MERKPDGQIFTTSIAIDALITRSGPRSTECAPRNGHKLILRPRQYSLFTIPPDCFTNSLHLFGLIYPIFRTAKIVRLTVSHEIVDFIP